MTYIIGGKASLTLLIM